MLGVEITVTDAPEDIDGITGVPETTPLIVGSAVTLANEVTVESRLIEGLWVTLIIAVPLDKLLADGLPLPLSLLLAATTVGVIVTVTLLEPETL